MAKNKVIRPPLERLRRKTVAYAVLYTLIALLTVSSLILLSFLNRMRSAEEESLLQMTRPRTLAVEEYLGRLEDIARLAALSSPPRNALEAFFEGGISRDQLQQITVRNLQEVSGGIEEIAGITRVDRQGEVVARTGVPLPEDRIPPKALATKEPFLSDPLVIDGMQYILAGSPIRGADGEFLGTDLVLFPTSHLQRIVWEETNLPPNGDAILGQMKEGRAEIFFPGRRGERELYNTASEYPLYERALQNAARGKFGLLYAPGRGYAVPDLVAYAPVGKTRWGLLVTMDRADLYARVDRFTVSLGALVLILASCGGAGMALLLRPLTGKALIYSSEIEQLNHDLRQEIVERRKAEQGLRRSEREWAQTFEAITDAVAILDAGGNILKMNRANLSFLNSLSHDVLSEKRCKVHFGLETSDRICPFTQMKQSKQPEFGELYEPKSDRYFHISIYPLLSEEGELWGGVHIAQDVTEQKKLEKVKDEMISSVSHEMRTPLTAMLGFVEYLLENPVEPEQQREFLQTVHRETERLNDLISNFLDLQRLQAQLETYSFEPLPVCPLVLEIVQLFAVASRKHPVRMDCAPELPLIRGDARRLQQVLKNLVSNAIRYSPEGGEIVVGACQEGDKVKIWVQDEGLGIPPQALSKIFNRFYRVDDSARRIPGGIGLGLALVREVVRAHDGKVWVESTVGKGSTFYFTVPLAE